MTSMIVPIKEIVGTMMESKKARRWHSAQFKAEVVAACEQPGASVAEVSRRYDLNANLVQTWRRQARAQAPALPPTTPAGFIPVVCTQPPTVPGDIHLDIRWQGAQISVTWPVAAASECAQWLRECLR